MTTYTNAQYVNGPPTASAPNVLISCLINGVQSYVPCDPGNTDYLNIMALISENTLVVQPAANTINTSST